MISKIIKNERGIILTITVTVMAVLVLVTYTFMGMISAQSRVVASGVKNSQALWLAEAGMEKYLYLLKTDSNYRTNTPDLSENLASGDYSVSAVYNSGSDIYTVTSTGTTGDLVKSVRQGAAIVASAPLLEAFTKGMNTSVYSIKFQSTTGGVVNGDIACGWMIPGLDEITLNGTATEFSENIFPSCDYDQYAAIADNVVSGPMTFLQNQTYSGIWYVTGNATIESGVTINGSVITRSNLQVSGSSGINITAGAGAPAIAAEGGIAGQSMSNSTINGLLYTNGAIAMQQNSGNTYNGAVVSAEEIRFMSSTNFTITNDTSLLQNLIGFSDDGSGSGGGGSGSITLQNDWEEI
jgi:Tfp pilus assembly protein PilX